MCIYSIPSTALLADSAAADLGNNDLWNTAELTIQVDQLSNTEPETEALVQSTRHHSEEKIHGLRMQNVEWWSSSTVTCSLNTDISQRNAETYFNEPLCNATEVSSNINDGKLIK